MSDDIKYKKGELIAISSGEYSDYCVNGLFKVLEDINVSEKLKEWAKIHGKIVNGCLKEKKDGLSFIGYLNSIGFVSDVEYKELHTGSYGEVELMG